MPGYTIVKNNGVLIHHGVKGMKWGVRRYQNSDGKITEAGRQRYGSATIDGMTDKNKYRYAKDAYKIAKKNAKKKYKLTYKKAYKDMGFRERSRNASVSGQRDVNKAIAARMANRNEKYSVARNAILNESSAASSTARSKAMLYNGIASSLGSNIRFGGHTNYNKNARKIEQKDYLTRSTAAKKKMLLQAKKNLRR